MKRSKFNNPMKNENSEIQCYMSKEVRTCQGFNVYRLFLFNSGYVLSLFDLQSTEEKEYRKRYIESSQLPEEITEDSEEFKELEKFIDKNVENYYKKYTDIEYKSEWDSPVAVLKELLKDLSIAIKKNREPDTNGEKELDQIINKYKNKPKPSKFETFEALLNTIKTLWETQNNKESKDRLNEFHSKKDFLELITDSEIKYNVKAVDEELYNHYEKLKKILNEKDDYLYFYNSYKNEFDDDIIKCIHSIIKRKNKLILINKFENDTELRDELIEFLDNKKENHEGVILSIYAILKNLDCSDKRILNYINDLIKKCSSPINEYTEQKVKEIINIFTNRDFVTTDEYKTVIKANMDNLQLLNKLLNYVIKKEKSYIPTLLNYLEHENNKGELERKTQLARIELSKVLGEEMNVVRREKIGTTYILHPTTNSYIKIEHDELIKLIADRIGRKYLIGDDDLKTAIKHLFKRIKPSFNLVKLNNCLIDMNTVEKVETDKPVLCLLDLPYDYNPEAQSEVVNNFLWSSLYDTDDKTTQKKIQGLYELLGYLLTNGNKEEIILFLVGKKGGGKSVLGQIITALVGGGKNTCDVKLDEIGGNNQHATAPFIDAHLNLVQEQDKKPIKNTGAIKQVSGDDYMMINPKFKPQVLLEPEEVPKTVIMCNNLPDLTQDTALIDRVITLQFKKSFRNTDEQIKDLDKLITEDKEAMEYILYNSLQAYKPIAQGEKELTLREDEEIRIETINKNADPIRFYLEQYVELDENNDIFDPDFSVGYNDVAIPDLKQLIKIESDKDGVQVDTGKDGLPQARKFKKIFCEIFDIDDTKYFNTKGFRREGKLIKYYNHLKFKEGIKNKLEETNNEKNTRIKEEITPIKEYNTDMNEIQKQEHLNNDKCIVNKTNAKILINLYGTMYNHPPMTFEEINKEYPYSKDYNDEGEVLLLRKFLEEFVKKGLLKEIKDNKIIKYSIDSNKLNNVYCNVKITDNDIKHLDIKTSVNIKSLEQYKIGDKVELPIPQAHLLLINNKCLID